MTGPGRATGPEPDARDERGAMAVVVALVATLVLVPLAALGVDLGNAYTVAAALQRAADAAAEAGAQELARQQRAVPAVRQQVAVQAATAAAVAVLCHDPILNPGPRDGAGVPQGPWHDRCATGQDWTHDGDTDPSDPGAGPGGAVEFYRGTRPAGQPFAAGQAVDGSGTDLVTGIRVVTPTATVRYGFAALLGASSGRMQRSASAELRTVLPARDHDDRTGTGANLRLYLTPADLLRPGSATLAWCARSGPRESWKRPDGTESNHPTGVCDPAVHLSVPRGYLAASAATHPYVPGAAVALQPQRWPEVARLRDLTTELVGSGGRLAQSGCRGGTGARSGGYSGLEAAHLGDFTVARIGEASALERLILSGQTPTPEQEGWLSPDLLRCGRLAVVPVLVSAGPAGTFPTPPDSPPTPTGHYYGLATTTYVVRDLALVWIDNTFGESDPTPLATTTQPSAAGCFQRGLYWENAYTQGYCPPRNVDDAPLRAITGYLINPALLPAVVPESDAVNTTSYLRSRLPVVVRLVRDVSHPPAT